MPVIIPGCDCVLLTASKQVPMGDFQLLPIELHHAQCNDFAVIQISSVTDSYLTWFNASFRNMSRPKGPG